MKIGPHVLLNPVILAPMAGVTDLPYRNLCRELGAGAAVAEMLTSNQSLWESRKSSQRQIRIEEQGLRWIQILGNDPQMMASAAQACEQRGAQVLDINMGCPAKKVCRKAAGSALLQDEKLVEQILAAVVKAVDIPVTVKIRTGYSPETRNALRIGQIAEQCGVAALSLHGRTRACRYEAAAEHDTAGQLKQQLSIPLIVNGDITTPQRARAVLQYTGADGVMIGRSALGNPWLPGQIARFLSCGEEAPGPTLDEICSVMERHVAALHRHYGEYMGVRIARRHVGWYEQQFPRLQDLRQTFNGLQSPEAQLEFLADFRVRTRMAA